MKKIKLDVSRMTVLAKVVFGDDVVPACTGNALLPTCTPRAALLGTKTYTLRQAANAVSTADAALKMAATARDTAEAAWDVDALALADGVEADAKSNEAALESSHFVLTSERTPPQPLGQVENLSLTSNRFTEQLDAHWDRLTHAASFEVQSTLTPQTPGSWQPLTSTTRSKITLTGLTSAQDLWIRVRGIGGSTGFGPWSQPAHRIVP